MVTRPAWGYTVETATPAIRLVLSGVFEKYPKLKIILGHLGETLPFLVWRIDLALKRPGQKAHELPRHFLQQLLHHHERQFLRSGAALLREEMGVDHILFAVDWPFVPNPPATGVDGNRAALRRGQGQDPLRQRQTHPENVGRHSRCRRGARNDVKPASLSLFRLRGRAGWGPSA